MNNGQKHIFSFISRFSPKSGPSPRTVQLVWTVGNSRKNTLSLVREPEKRSSARWWVCRDSLLSFSFSFSISWPSLRPAPVSKWQCCGSSSTGSHVVGTQNLNGKPFPLARGMENWTLVFLTVLGGGEDFFLFLFSSSFFILRVVATAQTAQLHGEPKFWE